jgi:plasmid stabilization system protein ParE
MKPVRFHPEAESEMNDAAAWYEAQRRGLGKRLIASVEDAVNRIRLNPELYQAIDEDVRRCLTATFPFGVLFRIRPDSIEIVAVMHLRREPGYWAGRASDAPQS